MDFDRVYLQGEISNLALPRSGHVYFNIKDENAQIAGVMFRPVAQRIKFQLENGLEVFLKGRISVYEPRGQYQLIVNRIEPRGAGALQFAFEQLKAKLQKKGWFAAEHKKPLPFLPKGIGIVTSDTGAVIRDIINILDRRFPGIPVLLNPVSVQGEGAAAEIAQAIEQFQAISDIDVLIVGRGGGSVEDLWSFNEEIVARAIFNSAIPIVSAVGHETDFTIADFVADVRAPTPSAAAELSVPEKRALIIQIEDLRHRLDRLIAERLERYCERLEYCAKRLRSPKWAIQTKTLRVDDLTEKLDKALSRHMLQYRNRWEKVHRALLFQSPIAKIETYGNKVKDFRQMLNFFWKNRLEQKKTTLRNLAYLLKSLSPLSVLTRGYATIADTNQKRIKSIRQVEKDTKIFVRVADGTIHGSVEKTTPNTTT